MISPTVFLLEISVARATGCKKIAAKPPRDLNKNININHQQSNN